MTKIKIRIYAVAIAAWSGYNQENFRSSYKLTSEEKCPSFVYPEMYRHDGQLRTSMSFSILHDELLNIQMILFPGR